MPDTRSGVTKTFQLAIANDDRTVDIVRLYFTVGLYEDGRPGEIFIKAERRSDPNGPNKIDDKSGSFVSGVLAALGVQMSIALQYGIPLYALVEKIKNQQFKPDGFTKDTDVPSCKSVLDLLAQWLIHKFPVHAKPPE